MDITLIANWNSVVGDNDIVFICGDFAFADKGKWRSLLNSLHGSKYLIQGNHDRDGDIPTEMFESVDDMLQVSIWDDELNGYFTAICTHFPLATWAGIQKGIVNACGHIHSKPDLSGNGFDMVVARNAPWNQYDVGVDRNSYYPVSYEDLKVIFTQRMLYGTTNITD